MANDFKRMWTKEEIKEISKEGVVTEEQFEELVKVTPTDVSIIEDQGKLELMLEHDGNVLAINDTPNQYLQRRLDKPSKVIESVISEQDYFELYNACRVGSIVKFYNANIMENAFSYNTPCFGIVTNKYYTGEGETYSTYIKITMLSMLFYSNPNYFQIRFERDNIYESDGTDLYMYYHTLDEIKNVSFPGGVVEPDDETHPLHNQPVIKNISVF